MEQPHQYLYYYPFTVVFRMLSLLSSSPSSFPSIQILIVNTLMLINKFRGFVKISNDDKHTGQHCCLVEYF